MGYLEEGVLLSEYNEGTQEQKDYYVSEYGCRAGEKAYVYSHEDDSTTELEIIHVIRRSDDMAAYDELLKQENVLVDGESKYGADTSAEFITDDDCYLMWFKYISCQDTSKEVSGVREVVMTKWRDAYMKEASTMIEMLRSEEALDLTKEEKRTLLEWCGDDEYAFVDDMGCICPKRVHRDNRSKPVTKQFVEDKIIEFLEGQMQMREGDEHLVFPGIEDVRPFKGYLITHDNGVVIDLENGIQIRLTIQLA